MWYLRSLLLLCFVVVSSTTVFGQEDPSTDLKWGKHQVFWNTFSILDPNGSSLQLGYSYQIKPWMDMQLELGYASDDVLGAPFPYREFEGFRVRPQLKFAGKNSLYKDSRFYGGIMLAYQRLVFNENRNFRIADSFNQNISYQGNENVFAWYITGGIDAKLSKHFTISLSFGVGQVFNDVKITKGDIPPDAVFLETCGIFCGRSYFRNDRNQRGGGLFELKFGYTF